MTKEYLGSKGILHHKDGKRTMVDLNGEVFTLPENMRGSVNTFTPFSGKTTVHYKDNTGKWRRTK